MKIYNVSRCRLLRGHEMRILLREKINHMVLCNELKNKYVLLIRTDADDPGMRVVLHEEQRERFNAGSLVERVKDQ